VHHDPSVKEEASVASPRTAKSPEQGAQGTVVMFQQYTDSAHWTRLMK